VTVELKGPPEDPALAKRRKKLEGKGLIHTDIIIGPNNRRAAGENSGLEDWEKWGKNQRQSWSDGRGKKKVTANREKGQVLGAESPGGTY